MEVTLQMRVTMVDIQKLFKKFYNEQKAQFQRYFFTNGLLDLKNTNERRYYVFYYFYCGIAKLPIFVEPRRNV